MLVLVGLQVVQMLADRTITTFTLVVFGQVVDILATVRLVILIQLVREQVIVQIVIVIIIQVHACIHFIVIIFLRHLLVLVVLRFISVILALELLSLELSFPGFLPLLLQEQFVFVFEQLVVQADYGLVSLAALRRLVRGGVWSHALHPAQPS